jgi:hypothetical protein
MTADGNVLGIREEVLEEMPHHPHPSPPLIGDSEIGNP